MHALAAEGGRGRQGRGERGGGRWLAAADEWVACRVLTETNVTAPVLPEGAVSPLEAPAGIM